MNTIKHYLVINSDTKSVYSALTEQKGLKSWWTEDTIAEPKVGSTNEFVFGDLYHDKMIITNLEEDKTIEWECIEGDKEWIGTKFKFSLEKRENHTVLRFAHFDWRDETDFFASCNYHWGYYLRSLKLFCETGTGTPFKRDE